MSEIGTPSNWTHLEAPHYTVTAIEPPMQCAGYRLKAPSDANWHDAVAYIRDDEPGGHINVRSIDDFLKYFVSSENWKEGRP